MDALDEVLRHAHVWNSWLVLVTGCAALGGLIVSARRGTRRGSRMLGAFVGAVHLQVVLGVALGLLLTATGDEFFAGDGAKAGWHAGLGVAAAVSATAAIRLRRRPGRAWPAVLAAATALVAPQPARLPLIVLGVLAAVGAAALIERRPPRVPQPMSPSQESR
ncbi:hypothetical protein O7630_16805 [Micromonospora sp. WMMD718]|uniref:hypothetical protein n=1 Tax=unclassified Micromonospora TaxID=2617518 RepID=UPI00069CCDC9|nr:MULTISPECIES: hypothetical protein [unclassified Micromonospora]MDG4752607.1 hypothetical protein [Micromonospora sp. WMMD718]